MTASKSRVTAIFLAFFLFFLVSALILFLWKAMEERQVILYDKKIKGTVVVYGGRLGCFRYINILM